jgi:hypothetical protein
MNEEAKSIGEKIPFVMLTASVFFRGIIFVILNAPLVIPALENIHFDNLNKLLSEGVVASWVSITSVQSTLSSSILFFLLILIIGFATTPLEQVLAGLVSLVLEFPKVIKMRKTKTIKFVLFSPLVIPNKDYIKVIEWFAYHPQAKVQWEWQQLFYHLWWSFAMSLISFTIISNNLIDISSRTQAMQVLIPVTIVFLIGAIYHAWHMGNVHFQAISRMKADKDFGKTFSDKD